MNSLIALTLLFNAHAAPPRVYLNIGDLAPALKPARWLKGSPVLGFEKGKVYVVEFWATWCGPCKENIPHLTELAKKFKGKASISGISIWENNDPTSTAYLKKVADFVTKQGDHMVYNVAVDSPDSRVGNAWMKAADLGGIPSTFIVGKDQRIAWIGHPANLESVLTQVVEDKFDVKAARDRRELEVGTIRPIRESMDGKKFAQAITLIDAAVAKKPEIERMYTYDRLVALFHVKPSEAKAAADEILKTSGGDIGAYRMVVSIFASQKDLSKETYTYGKDVVQAALQKGEMKYMFLAMSAEIEWSLGNKAAAISAQEEAVTAAEGDSHAPADFVAFLKKNLARFKG